MTFTALRLKYYLWRDLKYAVQCKGTEQYFRARRYLQGRVGSISKAKSRNLTGHWKCFEAIISAK